MLRSDASEGLESNIMVEGGKFMWLGRTEGVRDVSDRSCGVLR